MAPKRIEPERGLADSCAVSSRPHARDDYYTPSATSLTTGMLWESINQITGRRTAPPIGVTHCNNKTMSHLLDRNTC